MLSVFFAGVSTTASFALQSNTPSSSSEQPQAATTGTSDTAAGLNSRLEDRRNRLKTKLTNVETARVKASCASAQAKIQALTQKVATNNQAYQARYDTFGKQLTTLQQAQKNAGSNTVALDTQINTLTQKYQTYKVSADQVLLSLNDTKLVDCTTDPNGFKATVIDARAQLQTMLSSRKDTTKYAKESVLSALQTIKAANQGRQ